EGGYPEILKRLRDLETRKKIAAEVKIDSDKWENLYLHDGSPDRIILADFTAEKLKPFSNKSLAEAAKMRGKDPIETIMDLLVENEKPIGATYFLMSEENVKKEIAQPWISFGSDEASQAPEGVFLKSTPHPRAYGTFARVLGKYGRETGARFVWARKGSINDCAALRPFQCRRSSELCDISNSWSGNAFAGHRVRPSY